MLIQMQQRRATAANWTSANPILADGEIGYESDTQKFKIGNGSSAWTSLGYLLTGTGVDISGTQTITGAKTFSTKTTFRAADASAASINMPHGVIPTTPVNGDVWTTTSGLQYRINGATVEAAITIATQMLALISIDDTTTTHTNNIAYGATTTGLTKTVNLGTGGLAGSTTAVNIGASAGTSTVTLNGKVQMTASTTTAPSLNIPHGTAPTTPTNGDIWTTTAGLLYQINGSTFQAATTTAITLSGLLNVGTSTAAITFNAASGATTTGLTKTVNFGTGGVAGSTTNVTIGTSSGGTSNITLNGTTTVAGGALKPATGTATLVPMQFTSGTNLTTPLVGGVEFDGDKFYLTTNAGTGRGFVYAPQKVISTANSGAITTTTPVTPFTASNDVLTLETGKLYYFKGTYYTTATFTSGTAAIQLGFTFSNAPVGIRYNFKTYNQAAGATISLMGSSATAAATTVSAGVTSTISHVIEFEGYFTSNATTGGTISPFVQMSATGSSTVVLPFSSFEIVKLGASATTTVAGAWA